MPDRITLIVGRSYTHGMQWLRQNQKRTGLDAQRCRIVTTADAFLGLEDYNVIWLTGWSACVAANAIRRQAELARNSGRIHKEITP